MYAYGQVKGKRYDACQTLYKKRKKGKRPPVYYGARKFKTAADLARFLKVSTHTVFDHIKSGKPYRGVLIRR